MKIFGIKEFNEYLNVGDLKSDDLHIVNFEGKENIRLKSETVAIDFYLLSIKPHLSDAVRANNPHLKDMSDSAYMYVDCPQNSLEWDIKSPMGGYAIMISAGYLEKFSKDYNFVHYNNHEALFLTEDEVAILWDLFKKADVEFQKKYYSKNIIISYVSLIMTYVRHFYDRQFDTRKDIYHKVIDEFHKNLTEYFVENESLKGLPSVAFFAQKSFLSPNYFGDLIKHFTGKAPIDHIHDYVVVQAKDRLKNTDLSISEISYSLGFDYPNYFARFFRKKTGLSPKTFRNQSDINENR